MTGRRHIHLSRLAFTSPDQPVAEIRFSRGLNVLHGASNTGKTFAVKAIDFMLGGSTPLPDIGEREGYDRVWLGLDLPEAGSATLRRPLAGGRFALFHDLTDLARPPETAIELSAKHDASRQDNLSQFLLNELGLSGRQIATDANGKKRPLSFRDLARFCIIDERSIQSEDSPVESGQVISQTGERSLFRLLLTGQDDSSLTTILDSRTFRTSTSAKIEILDDMVVSIEADLAADYPDAEELAEQNDNLEQAWSVARHEAAIAQQSIRDRLAEKGRLVRIISAHEQRRSEIQINFARFEQLAQIYESDIRRLEGIEEAGFVLALSGEKPCPLCGAAAAEQRHSHGLEDIQRMQLAALAEIAKIHKQQRDLAIALSQLDVEGLTIETELLQLKSRLQGLEAELADMAPAAAASKARLDDLLATRDHVRQGLALIQQRASLLRRKEELQALRPVPKADRPHLGVPSHTLHEFAQKIGQVLEAWQFPGKRVVSFADGAYDLRIDGKNRKDNGKGVRAVTHAAFKVALMLFCSERQLPHPGFVVLDTPLLTYRDPITSNDPLSGDEAALKNTSLKGFFFEHLSSISQYGQVIVVENVDLPPSISGLGHVEVFTGLPGHGRAGLFPGHS